MLSYGDHVTIKVIKVKDEFGNFLHWEHEINFSNSWYEAGGTSPDFYGSIDSALDYIKEEAQHWMSANSNWRKH